MEEINKSKLLSAMYKKALGYSACETTEEYTLLDGQMTVTKQKLTTKDSPPDISAAKILLDLIETDDFASMSDEELEKEKVRLLSEFGKSFLEKTSSTDK